jgi:hypothetical protein
MHKWFPLIVSGFMVIIAVSLLLSMAAMPATSAQEMGAKPPPTWTPGPVPTKTPISGDQQTPSKGLKPGQPRQTPIGGSIELCVRFPQMWPWAEVHWQDLWTVVQWQDAWGDWHDVEGWQGSLDQVIVVENGQVVGKKTWWVARHDLGTGPFRWLIYQGKESRLLGASEPFYLPDSGGAIKQVEVAVLTE